MSLPEFKLTHSMQPTMIPDSTSSNPANDLSSDSAAKARTLVAVALFVLTICACANRPAYAETCTTQSQMAAADRDAIASAARDFAAKVQSNDATGLRQRTLPDYAKDFSAMSSLIGNTAGKIGGAALAVDEVYLLDAASLKTLGDGTNPDSQFFCSINKSPAEVNFLIPALPPGRYAFAIVTAQGGNSPWRLSFLMKQQPATQWSMAGFYPRPVTAAGHDGLWYWTQARALAKEHQLYTAYLYYQQARTLLQPTAFTTSSHLDKLLKEQTAVAPPALSEGLSADTPLVIKGPGGSDFRITGLTTDDSLGADKVDVVIHIAPDPIPDTESGQPASSGKSPAKASATPPTQRNTSAMAALLAAYPELRASFHGVWVFADASGKAPFITELPMAAIH